MWEGTSDGSLSGALGFVLELQGKRMSLLAGIVIVAFSLFLVGLTVVVFTKPEFAERFLLSFASSARAHFAEQACRLLVGSALVVRSPTMWQPQVFRLLGWAVVVSAAVLVVLPWRWHHRFGGLVLPPFVRYMKLCAVGLFAFGCLLLYAVFAAGSRSAT